MILCFFVISIFVVKERVVNSNCISMLSFGICSSFFGVFIRAFLERVCQSSNFYNASHFFLQLWIYQSINLSINLSAYLSMYQSINLSINQSTSNLPANLSIRSYLSKFSKGSFISWNSIIYQNRLSWNSDSNKGFIRTLLGCVYMCCHQKLLS